MYETIRIVGKLRPKYVMWENVKNLLSKNHKHNFDAYIETMNILGYNSYYQVLNGKNYGIPQNRERVYTISIRKDIDKGNFVFPEKEELQLRLKDMLEEQVDEKYYLSDKFIQGLLKHNENHIEKGTGFIWKPKNENEIANTLRANASLCPTDNTIKCKQIGNLSGGKWDKINESCRRVYSGEGLSPTIHTCQGGNTEPKILEEKLPGAYGRNFGSKGKIQNEENICDTLQAAMGNGGGNVPIIKTIGNYMPSGHDASRIVDSEGLAPTVKENHGTVTAVAEPLLIKNNTKQGYQEAYEGDGINISSRMKYQRGNVQKEMCQTLTSSGGNDRGVIIDYRIRKLTPKECWRLMGFDDEDFEKAEKVNSNTQLYKQARKFNYCKCIRKNTMQFNRRIKNKTFLYHREQIT